VLHVQALLQVLRRMQVGLVLVAFSEASAVSSSIFLDSKASIL
jgi:hypothetical protein